MIDTKTVEQVRNTDLVAFFERHCGFTFAYHGDEYRCKQHKSLAVKSDRLSWFWHSKGVGGFGVLDYLIKVDGYDFRQAVEAITTLPPVPSAHAAAVTKPPQSLILPEKAFIYKRLFAYLCKTRCIDNKVVSELIREKKLYEDTRGNVVFVGHDEQGEPRFACLRGTYTDKPYRADCPGSDKRYSFNMPCDASERLFIFESPIDAMSHASLEIAATGDVNAWKQHSRLSLAGTSDTALLFFLNKRPVIRELIFCLDNDPAGREATAVMARRYSEKGYKTSIILPAGKDFNEDLQASITAKAHKITKPKGLDI